jgi:hypothetical protein
MGGMSVGEERGRSAPCRAPEAESKDVLVGKARNHLVRGAERDSTKQAQGHSGEAQVPAGREN